MKKHVLVGCMDVRHDCKLGNSIREAAGIEGGFYTLTAAGGAGILTGTFEDMMPNAQANMIEQIQIAINKLGAERVCISVHGSSEEDSTGCGGYVLCGHGDQYETSERSREFSHMQLRKAASALRKAGIEAPIDAFYVTFDSGKNLIEKVEVPEEEEVAQVA